MQSGWGRGLAVALVAVGGAAGLAAAAHDAPEPGEREMVVVLDAGDGDKLEIDDLAELEVGESRTYRTSAGKPATVTRDDEGYAIELDGKTTRIAERIGFGPGAMFFGEHPGEKVKMRRIEVEGDGGHGFVITDDPEHEVEMFSGKAGEHGLMFHKVAAPPPPFFVDALLERLGKNEKFGQLDDATQELVREAIRESGAAADWIGFPGAPDGATRIMVRERHTKENDAGEE